MTQALLTVDALNVHFGALHAVQDVSFHIQPQEIVGLVGPNGAGKSTTFNAISGLRPPNSGQTTFQGCDITGFAPDRVARAGITRTFQNVRLFAGLSVLENVMMGAYATASCGVMGALVRLGRHRSAERRARDTARRLVERLGLTAYANTPAVTLPLGLQRVAEVARALAGEPSLLLLDEPAAGLNPTEKGRLSTLLRTAVLESGCALLLVEHDMPMVMALVERVIVLDFGRKLAEGTPAEVARNPDVIRVYLGA